MSESKSKTSALDALLSSEERQKIEAQQRSVDEKNAEYARSPEAQQFLAYVRATDAWEPPDLRGSRPESDRQEVVRGAVAVRRHDPTQEMQRIRVATANAKDMDPERLQRYAPTAEIRRGPVAIVDDDATEVPSADTTKAVSSRRKGWGWTLLLILLGGTVLLAVALWRPSDRLHQGPSNPAEGMEAEVVATAPSPAIPDRPLEHEKSSDSGVETDVALPSEVGPLSSADNSSVAFSPPTTPPSPPPVSAPPPSTNETPPPHPTAKIPYK